MATSVPAWLESFRRSLAAELVETTISWVLLTDDYAYKVKKPLVLPFLDYGSAQRRLFCCREELRLNSRFAPDLYLDVVAIGDTGEAAVRMRRFDEAGRLDRVCGRRMLSGEEILAIARVIGTIHATAAVAAGDTRFGLPQLVLDQALENFDELRPRLPDESDRLEWLAARIRLEIGRRTEQLLERKRSGHIREGHGDLHLSNLVLADDRITAFDCIEFNEELRWIDVASELAFTYVDLLHRSGAGAAALLLNDWLSEYGDYAAIPVLRGYAAHRALVRAKVAVLAGDRESAVSYLNLAERVLSPPPATLTITFGLSGSGKTTASAALLVEDPNAATLRLRSDVERKRIFGIGEFDHSADRGRDIYSVEADDRTYAFLAERAELLLRAGWSVVVDAAFLSKSRRAYFEQRARDCGVRFAILRCQAPLAELRERLRARRADASEADQGVLDQQLLRHDPLSEYELTLVVDPRPPPAVGLPSRSVAGASHLRR
jgi:aminoglycoside phosphotransferase family enzyme/predicted kinase